MWLLKCSAVLFWINFTASGSEAMLKSSHNTCAPPLVWPALCSHQPLTVYFYGSHVEFYSFFFSPISTNGLIKVEMSSCVITHDTASHKCQPLSYWLFPRPLSPGTAGVTFTINSASEEEWLNNARSISGSLWKQNAFIRRLRLQALHASLAGQVTVATYCMVQNCFSAFCTSSEFQGFAS